MIIENFFQKDALAITYSFCRFYLNFVEKGPIHGNVVKADQNMTTLLWEIKDRSASLHKSLRILQTLFEEMKLIGDEEKIREPISQAFLKSLSTALAALISPLESKKSAKRTNGCLSIMNLNTLLTSLRLVMATAQRLHSAFLS